MRDTAIAIYAGAAAGAYTADLGLRARMSPAERMRADRIESFVRAFDAALDKGACLSRLRAENPDFRGLSRSNLYRWLEAWRSDGRDALAPAGARRRVAAERGSRLPAAFVSWWQGRCGLHQRGKVLSVYKSLFTELVSGHVIPGYGRDWRGIWAAEHPGDAVPERCPYEPGRSVPNGWSYRNLVQLAPSKAARAAATRGLQAATELLPKIPHTRVGLPFASVFFFDDVQHDFYVTERGKTTRDRPVELAMIEGVTARVATRGLLRVQRTDDGSRLMLQGRHAALIFCDVICRVGVNAGGVTFLAEHGTAQIRPEWIAAVNRLAEKMGLGPGFAKVALSKTFGAPLVSGLYGERASGNPRWKAPLESMWNLVHNMTATLPGQIGHGRGTAPADDAGRESEWKRFGPLLSMLQKEAPEDFAAYSMGYMNYFEAERFLEKVYGLLEERTFHDLAGWSELGFTRKVAILPGGELDLGKIAAETPEKLPAARELVETLGGTVREVNLSPRQAWDKCAARTKLVRFPVSLAAEILSDVPGAFREAEVSQEGTFRVRELDGAPRTWTFNAIIEDECGGARHQLPVGSRWKVVFSPFDHSRLLVCSPDGRYAGATDKPYEAVRYAESMDTDSVKGNLALLSQGAKFFRGQLRAALAAQKERRIAEVDGATALLLEKGAALLGAGEASILSRRLGSADPADLSEISAGPAAEAPDSASLQNWDPAAPDCDAAVDLLASISAR